MGLFRNDSIESLLSDIKFLEETARKKDDVAYGKSMIIKQQERVFRLLKERETEKKVLNDIVNKIRAEELMLEKTSTRSSQYITKLKGFSLNFEAIFKKEINAIKTDLMELNNIYNSQKDTDTDKYFKSVKEEKDIISGIEKKLHNILNSREQIQTYIGEISKVKELVKQDRDYDYLGFKIPANIKIIDPISRYELEPFLIAYKKYKDIMKDITIQLRYGNFTKDFMRSQYSWKFLFQKPQDRIYMIKTSRNMDDTKGVTINQFSLDEKIGWYAHELNHVLQFSKMSKSRLVGWSIVYGFNFALSYVPFLDKLAFRYLRQAERRTDDGAIRQGAGYELAQGSNHFFNGSTAPKAQKERYSQVYTPTNDVMDKTSKEYFYKLKNHRDHSK